MESSLKAGIIRVLFANIINLLFNLLTNFVLPKYLSVDSYAAIKTFQLYSSYIGVMSLGYLDGIYLKYGGKQLNKIEVKDLQTTADTARIFQFVMTVIVVCYGIISRNKIIIAFGASILPINMAYYYKNLYQAVGAFKKYGRILNATACATFVANAILVFFVKTDLYIFYLSAYVLVYYLIWLVMEIQSVNGKSFPTGVFLFSLRELIDNIKSGILLLFGNLSSVLMTSLDRWCIKLLMDNVAFAQYSFAVSIEGFMNVAVSPVTVTLYNYFCTDHSKSEMIRIRNCVMIFACAIVTCAFPGRFILETYLTNYLAASKVMFLLFASQIFYIIIKSIYVNLYKARKKQNLYFTKLIIVILIGLLLNISFFKISAVKESFALGTLLSAICWFLLCYPDFKDLMFGLKEFIYPFLEMGLFIVCGFTFNSIIGCCIYCIGSIFITMMLLSRDFKYLIRQSISLVQRYTK